MERFMAWVIGVILGVLAAITLTALIAWFIIIPKIMEDVE